LIAATKLAATLPQPEKASNENSTRLKPSQQVILNLLSSLALPWLANVAACMLPHTCYLAHFGDADYSSVVMAYVLGCGIVTCVGMADACSMMHPTVRSQAVAGGIDTRGLFSGSIGSPQAQALGEASVRKSWAGQAKQVSWQSNTAQPVSSAHSHPTGHDTSKLSPEIAELVNIARFASSQPLYGLGNRAPAAASTVSTPWSQFSAAASMGGGNKFAELGGESTDVQDTVLSMGQNARIEQRHQAKDPTPQPQALAVAQETLRPTRAPPKSESGGELSIRQQVAQIPGPSGPGGLVVVRELLAKASVHVVAEYWRQNYQELMKVDQLGTKRKMTDLGRGRGYDHVPSALAPLLSGLRLPFFALDDLLPRLLIKA